jgi:hypothetical protein
MPASLHQPGSAREGRMRILLVEDEPELATVLAAALRDHMLVDHVATLSGCAQGEAGPGGTGQ